eukprot:1458616-Pyramimonas_sp.AAC.1
MRLEAPIRSTVRPSMLFTQGLVDIAPWLPQCWMVRPIHPPAHPSSAPVSTPGIIAYAVYTAAAKPSTHAAAHSLPCRCSPFLPPSENTACASTTFDLRCVKPGEGYETRVNPPVASTSAASRVGGNIR